MRKHNKIFRKRWDREQREIESEGEREERNKQT